MYQRLFYFGEKSRHFSIDEIDDERSFLLNINDCSVETLKYIFKRIAYVINNPRSKKRVLANTPEEFIDYFNSPSNIIDFVSTFETIKCRSIRLQVRDYYLHWLHMAGSVGIRTETTLVSTSVDKNVALDFSNDKHDKYILHYFIPKPFYHHAVGYLANTIHEFSTTNSGLPNYNSLGLYPDQNEVGVKGALLPHFILGIELASEKKFLVNPHLRNIDENDFEKVAEKGFWIDQGEFVNRLAETAYIRWGGTDLEGNFEESDF